MNIYTGQPNYQSLTQNEQHYGDDKMTEILSWSVDDVANFLSGLGLGDIAPLFIEHNISGDILPLLTESDLLQMGITQVGPRKRLLNQLSKIKNAHRSLTRHKTIWRAEEDISRGNCFRQILASCCGCLFADPDRYRLTGTQLKITSTDEGFCLGLFRCCSLKHHNNNIALKEIVDIDTDHATTCCGSVNRVIICSQEGINDGQTTETELFIDGKGENTLSNVERLLQSAVDDAKESNLLRD